MSQSSSAQALQLESGDEILASGCMLELIMSETQLPALHFPSWVWGKYTVESPPHPRLSLMSKSLYWLESLWSLFVHLP